MSNFLNSSSTTKRPANSDQGEEDGTSAKRKKMNNTAFVQIATDPSIGPFIVVLSQKCSTVEEHANFLRDKINLSQGAILDGKLRLDGPVALVAVIMDSSALFDYDIQLEAASKSKYTFHFKLAIGEGEEQAENRPNLVDQLATQTQVAELEEKMASQIGTLTKLIGELAEKMEEMRGQLEVLMKKKNARFRIPNEMWTEVMKMLPRRFLVKGIAPVCFRFKEICDKNVKNIHLITKANWFSYRLKKNDPIAKKQLEQLAANDCQLADQFRLTGLRVIAENKVIMSHCPDLFKGSQITLHFNKKNKNSTLFLECLSQLETAKPAKIHISRSVDQDLDFWHNPTFQYCARVELFYWLNVTAATMTAELFVNVLEWLHYQPSEMDCNDATDQQVRGMVAYLPCHEHQHIDWLLNQCSQDIQQAQDVTDRRPFVFSFTCLDSEWANFGKFRQIVNNSTEEVLMLDRVIGDADEPVIFYRLRRCLAEEVANGEEFYAGLFECGRGEDVFKTDEKKPIVTFK